MRGNKWVWCCMAACLLVLLSACSTGAETTLTPGDDEVVEAGATPTTGADEVVEADPTLTQVVEPEPLPALDADEVAQKGGSCQAIYQGHIAAWDTRDGQNLRQVYTEDIVHFDGRPLYVDIDGVVEMADFMFQLFPDWGMAAGDTYISQDQCFGTWINWGVFGFTQEDPGREYDLLETRGDKISHWTLYYDQKFHSAFDFEEIDVVDADFLAHFAAAWSSGDVAQVEALYTEDASLEDTLYNVSISGNQAIAQYAKQVFNQSPGASWEVLETFAESKAKFPYEEEYPFSAQGGVFGINVNDPQGNRCQIRAVVVLTPNDDGLIFSQSVFYNAETLVACGWAE